MDRERQIESAIAAKPFNFVNNFNVMRNESNQYFHEFNYFACFHSTESHVPIPLIELNLADFQRYHNQSKNGNIKYTKRRHIQLVCLNVFLYAKELCDITSVAFPQIYVLQ